MNYVLVIILSEQLIKKGYEMKISKELLGKVLNKDISSIVGINNSTLDYIEYPSDYDLLQLLKCWAYDKGYPLTIIYGSDIVHVQSLKNGNEKRCYGSCKDELTPVIEMCEWILEQEKNWNKISCNEEEEPCNLYDAARFALECGAEIEEIK